MSLLAWYPLISNGNNQGLDGVNLEPIGSITYTDGKLGKAATFSANLANYLRRPQPKLYNNFSFACWYKLNSTTSTTWQQLFACGRDNSDGWGFRINGSNKRVVFHCGNVQYTYGTDLTIGTWHHVCMVIKDSNYTAYVDGTQVGTGSITTLPALTEWGTYFFVGCLSNSYYPLNGQVQDIRIYDNPLSKKEVKELSKGLMTHLPLSWGANPNMIKNSYTWMNKNLGSNNVMSPTKSIIEDNTAPCKNVMKAVFTNTDTSAKSNAGFYYTIGTQGLATTDLTSGETYTYSFWAKADSANTGNVALSAGAICESQTHVSNTGFGNLDSSWRKHTVTFKWTSTGKLTACFYMTIPASSTITIYLCGIKLEKGSVATQYIPHTAEAAYTGKGYANLYYDECSGFKRTTTVGTGSGGAVSKGTDSPRGTGTNFAFHQIYLENGFPVGTTPNFTIAFWQKGIEATQTRYADVVWLGVGNSSSTSATTRFRLETISTDGTSAGYVWYGNGVVTTGGGICGLNANAGTWRHVVLTFDGTTFKQYVNGAQYNTATLGSDYAGFKTYGTFAVGDTSANIQVELADVRVYATCLSADDIKELYNIPVQIDKTGKIYCNELVEV